MLAQLEAAIERHARVGIIVDANLLVLFLVGTFDAEEISEFKRTRAYSVDDFVLLARVLGRFDRVLVTPAILAEVSNLARQIRPHRRREFFLFLSRILPSQLLEERHVPVASAVAATGFVRLGVTDATIERLATEEHPVLTDDLDLYLHLSSRAAAVFNFNHLRQLLLM